VRSSWLIRARKRDFASATCAAVSRAATRPCLDCASANSFAMASTAKAMPISLSSASSVRNSNQGPAGSADPAAGMGQARASGTRTA